MSNITKFDLKGHQDSDSVRKCTELKHIKKQLYRGNWCYLHRHPELRAIIRVFIHELINEQPENIYDFLAALFNCNNYPLLITKINQQLKLINKDLKNGGSTFYNGEEIYSKKGAGQK